MLKPRFVVLDEPTSALDMSVQAQIVELLRELQMRHGLAYLFISHDLRVVRALAHEIMVMKDGRIVETGATEQIMTAPRASLYPGADGRRLRSGPGPGLIGTACPGLREGIVERAGSAPNNRGRLTGL